MFTALSDFFYFETRTANNDAKKKSKHNTTFMATSIVKRIMPTKKNVEGTEEKTNVYWKTDGHEAMGKYPRLSSCLNDVLKGYL